jgi:hypothetical protein
MTSMFNRIDGEKKLCFTSNHRLGRYGEVSVLKALNSQH